MSSYVNELLDFRTMDSKRLEYIIKKLLLMPEDELKNDLSFAARKIKEKEFGNKVYVSGLVAFSSHCVNTCTYCGLRANNTSIPRYRLLPADVRNVIDGFKESGLSRVFLVSGEDRGYSLDHIIEMVTYAKSIDLRVSLGIGVYPEKTLKQLQDAGTDTITLKFETSNPELFQKIKPTSDFNERINCIKIIKKLGIELGSGNIIGIGGQTIDDIVSDIMLMKELDIDWAPIVPYLPAPGTPMAENTPMGNVDMTLRVLSIIRILLPKSLITASQPSQDSKLGFADTEGNKSALNAGANLLFVDMTPNAVRRDFQVTPGRILPGVAHVDKILEDMGMLRV